VRQIVTDDSPEHLLVRMAGDACNGREVFEEGFHIVGTDLTHTSSLVMCSRRAISILELGHRRQGQDQRLGSQEPIDDAPPR
jgi:hypothetical protein